MNSFGEIKSKVEKLLVKSYNKPEFKTNLLGFKKYILNNRQLSEAYYIYDNLSTKKGLNEDIAEEYISESLDYLKIIINKNQQKISDLGEWIDSLLNEDVDNDYTDIDNQIYTKNVVKNLEKLIESKQRIKNTLTSNSIKESSKSLNIPLSSMLSIATNTFNKEYSSLNEQEKKELKLYTSLSKKRITEEIENTKKSVLNKLSTKLNESDDTDLKNTINKTIENINNTQNDLISLYRIKQLDKGIE